MTALPLTPEEKAIAERQCVGCKYWDWFSGCHYDPSESDGAFPVPNCGVSQKRKEA